MCVLDPVHVEALHKLKGFAGSKMIQPTALSSQRPCRVGEVKPTKLADDTLQALRFLMRFCQSLKEVQAICLLGSYFPKCKPLFTNIFSAPSLAPLADDSLPEKIFHIHTGTLGKSHGAPW